MFGRLSGWDLKGGNGTFQIMNWRFQQNMWGLVGSMQVDFSMTMIDSAKKIQALRKLRQEDCDFQVRLGCKA